MSIKLSSGVNIRGVSGGVSRKRVKSRAGSK